MPASLVKEVQANAAAAQPLLVTALKQFLATTRRATTTTKATATTVDETKDGIGDDSQTLTDALTSFFQAVMADDDGGISIQPQLLHTTFDAIEVVYLQQVAGPPSPVVYAQFSQVLSSAVKATVKFCCRTGATDVAGVGVVADNVFRSFLRGVCAVDAALKELYVFVQLQLQLCGDALLYSPCFEDYLLTD